MTKTQEKEYEALFNKAHLAGLHAGDSVAVAPMYVVEHTNPLDDNSPIKKVYPPVMDGVCGFAWVNVRPGTSTFARWLRKTNKGRTDSYAGGVTIWVGHYNQSMTRKEAYARAFAEVLRSAGITAYSNSRMD